MSQYLLSIPGPRGRKGLNIAFALHREFLKDCLNQVDWGLCSITAVPPLITDISNYGCVFCICTCLASIHFFCFLEKILHFIFSRWPCVGAIFTKVCSSSIRGKECPYFESLTFFFTCIKGLSIPFESDVAYIDILNTLPPIRPALYALSYCDR